MFRLLIKFRLGIVLRIIFRLRFLKITRGKWVMARTSCLGTRSFYLIEKDIPYYNLSKSRMDFLAPSLSKKKRSVVPKLKMLDCVRRIDLLSPILNHCYSYYDAKKAPEFLIIDSGCDMADYKFNLTKNKNSFFYATFMDVNVRESRFIEYDRMISFEELESSYSLFFQKFNHQYPNTPIFFIHFPMVHENRKQLIERHIFFRQLIEKFSLEFNNLHSIVPPENIVAVKKEGDDKSPYHFNKEVYQFVANEINEMMKIKSLN